MLQMKGRELEQEVLSFVPLPRLDSDSATFLPFDECKLLMDNGSTLKDELSDLQKVQSDYADNDDEHAERKKRDTTKTKASTGLR